MILHILYFIILIFQFKVTDAYQKVLLVCINKTKTLKFYFENVQLSS